MRVSLTIAALAALLLGFAAEAANARPSRIILMRHAEKKDNFALCDLGLERATALSQQFLGKGAEQSLFPPGHGPDAFFAVTLHPLETVTPTAETWEAPVIDYSVVPKDDGDKDAEIDARTREAASALLNSPDYDGKTVVVVWEHKHIANRKLAGESPPVTFRELLNLDKLPDSAGVPDKWPGTNYDYFWIVDYGSDSDTPTSFKMVKQTFTGEFADIPDNDWDTPEKPRHMTEGCL